MPAPPRSALAWGAGTVFFAALYALTIRDGHPGGDFALYILHAANLVHGLPYAATGFVPDPANSIISPASYPPGFPLLLAPVYALAGVDLYGFKLLGICMLLALLPLVYGLARFALAPPLSAAVTVATGLMPDLFDRRDLILSDIPFAAWCVASLLCFEVIGHGNRRARSLCVIMGFCVTMACVTRSAGPALVVAICFAAIYRRKPLWRASVAAALLGLAAASFAVRLLHVDGTTYFTYFAQAAEPGVTAWLREAAGAYGAAFAGVMGLSLGAPVNLVLACVMLLLVGTGWLIRLRENAGAPEAFLPFYLALLAVFPVKLEPVRYLVPVCPLLLYYPAIALRRLRPNYASACIGAFCAIAFVPYYTLHDPLSYHVPLMTDAPSQALYTAVRRRTDKSELIMAANPRVLVLMANRRSAIWPKDPNAQNFWRYVREVKARYAVTDATDKDASNLAAAALLAGSVQAAPIWKNQRFSLWQLKAD